MSVADQLKNLFKKKTPERNRSVDDDMMPVSADFRHGS